MTFGLFVIGVCLIASAYDERKVNLFNTTETLNYLAEVKSTSKSLQKAYNQHSLLRPRIAEHAQALEEPLLNNTM